MGTEVADDSKGSAAADSARVAWRSWVYVQSTRKRIHEWHTSRSFCRCLPHEVYCPQANVRAPDERVDL